VISWFLPFGFFFVHGLGLKLRQLFFYLQGEVGMPIHVENVAHAWRDISLMGFSGIQIGLLFGQPSLCHNSNVL